MLSREKIRIENRWLYPSAIVDQLRIALSNGAELHADESRRKFYDLDTEGRTYFIYVSPVSGSVTLIATWARKRPSADAKSDEQAPWWRRITEHFLRPSGYGNCGPFNQASLVSANKSPRKDATVEVSSALSQMLPLTSSRA